MSDGIKVPGNKLSENGFTIPVARQIDKTKKPKDFRLSAEDRRQHLSYSRKAASAQVAKIPLELARHIARAWKPDMETRQPLAIDLFCGLGGWTEGLLAEGYRVIGFDLERHAYGDAKYPAQLVLQDVTTLHGRQFKDAALIVASPPCQAYSYRAMPWKKAKALPPPSNELFNACFRIQREAIEAAGHFIPLVVENVCGAQKWVGKARWHYGSFYLWGDVPALMPMTYRADKTPPGNGAGAPMWRDRPVQRLCDSPGPEKATKNDGGSWFNVAHNTTSGHGQNPDERKTLHLDGPLKNKTGAASVWSGASVKNGGDWFGSGPDCSLQRRQSSKGSARKAASAHIAKIPFGLACWIARAWKPRDEVAANG